MAIKTHPIKTGDDVIAFLKAQHAQVKGMFDDVLGAQGAKRQEAFLALRRLMAVHETAEEEIVHPAARHVLDDGDRIVGKRLSEEKKAKAALAELEDLDVDSREFEARLRALKVEVVAHAESEENEEFSKLSNALDPKHLHRMKKAAELAEAVAATRPHAGIESATANLLAGPFASMIDRAKDALSAKV